MTDVKSRSRKLVNKFVRQMTSPWFILLVLLVLTPVLFLSNLYHKKQLLYHDQTKLEYVSNSWRYKETGRRHAWTEIKAIRNQPCPLKYLYQRAARFKDKKVKRNQDEYNYQAHIPDELLNSDDTQISLTKLNIPRVFNSTFLNPCWYRSTETGRRKLYCLPYYFLAGFPKCGTTDLYYKMALHPQIRLAAYKEPHWWTRKRLPDANMTLENYEEGFDKAANCMEKVAKLHLPGDVRLITGDASASTLWDNHYWRLLPGNEILSEPRLILADIIRHYLPASRIIVIVRDPVYRLFSDYTYFWSNANNLPSAEDFHNKVKQSVDVVRDCMRNNTARACVYGAMVKTKVRIQVGMYSVYLRDWYRVFPRQQIHVLRTEDYATSPEKELRKIFNFLNLDPLEESVFRRMREMSRMNKQNFKGLKINMLPETELMLREFYQRFNRELAILLNNTDYLWLNNTTV